MALYLFCQVLYNSLHLDQYLVLNLLLLDLFCTKKLIYNNDLDHPKK